VSNSYPLLDALYHVLYEGAPAAEALWQAVRSAHNTRPFSQ